MGARVLFPDGALACDLAGGRELELGWGLGASRPLLALAGRLLAFELAVAPTGDGEATTVLEDDVDLTGSTRERVGLASER